MNLFETILPGIFVGLFLVLLTIGFLFSHYRLNQVQAFQLEAYEGLKTGILSLKLGPRLPVIILGLENLEGGALLGRQGNQLWRWVGLNPEAIQTVSRQHLYFKIVKGEIGLVSGSVDGKHAASNGTFINGKIIYHNEFHSLQDGDLIGLGPRAASDSAFSGPGGVTLIYRYNHKFK
jgi:hypothetical protein